MLEFIKDRIDDYDANNFVNELAQASKYLGILEAKIDSYKFNGILIPMLQRKEAVSSMYIEGTHTTIKDVLENEVKQNPTPIDERISLEVKNHTRTLIYGAEQLRTENFTHSFIKKIHACMLEGLLPEAYADTLGKYKVKDNEIVSTYGKVVYTPPKASETKKYMDELIRFMNEFNDGINPLIKAAIIHSQFESIHPYSDGNGRVGRLLVSLYLYKAKVINFPFFYISEAISIDKSVYYNMLTDSRENNYNEWIKYFLRKITLQTQKHIGYIDALNNLYLKTKEIIKNSINTTKFDEIIECIFTHPVMDADYLEDKLTVSRGQAVRYLNILEEKRVLQGNDRKRKRTFFFMELIELASGNSI